MGIIMAEQQGDFFPKGKGSGGARAGAGRKAKRPTTVMRVPEQFKSVIEDVIQHLESGNAESVVEHYRDMLDQPCSLKLVTKIKMKGV
jgi:hypothetical protein